MRRLLLKLQESTMHQNELINLNEYLLTKGFELSEEEIAKLVHVQKEICKNLKWIELDESKLYKIILPYTLSPYLSFDNKMITLENAILIYYKIRSMFDWHLDDETCITTCFKTYTSLYGIQDKELIKTIIIGLKKEGYNNNANDFNESF